MLKDFESNIAKNALFHKKDKLLLAISGGMDSVILANLLKACGFKFSLAHCNFKLRGKDSEADEKFCKDLAKKIEVKIYTKAFDIQAYCIEHKTNIQLAARKLRYDWFKELIQKEGFDYLLTAHHANDLMETFFINLLRGTGIKGLKGIPVKNEKVVRPLLNFTRQDLESYAKKNKIKFRLDKSNLDDKYERNFIRLNVIPALKKINSKIEETFIKNTTHLREEAEIVVDYMEERSTELITQTPEAVFINKKKLKREKYLPSILHHLLSGYGFNGTQEKNVLKNIREEGLAGKVFQSSSHRLIIDRNDLVIKAFHEEKKPVIEIKSLPGLKKQGFFKVNSLKKFTIPKKTELILEKNKLVFPLILRYKQTGDKFKPFGMKGFKLLSDFMKDEKMNVTERENCRVLVNGNGEIIWVVGYRSDERYKVKLPATDLLKISINE